MKVTDRLIPINKISMKTSNKRFLFVKRQLQNIIAQLENPEDEESMANIPHVHFYKKHKLHIFPRFEIL